MRFAFINTWLLYIPVLLNFLKKDVFHNVEALYESIRFTGINIIYLNIVLNINIEFIVYLTMVVVAHIT